MMPRTAAPLSRLSMPSGAQRAHGEPSTDGAHIEMLDVMSDLLLEVGENSPPDAFFSRLCEAICRLTSMRRAVLFRYDDVRRRVRAVGAHGIDLGYFTDLFVTIDSVPLARRALVEDRILEVVGADDFDVPDSVRESLAGVRMLWTPMAAGGRYVGVVVSEREPAAPPMGAEERHLLWTLAKAIAMASVARDATRLHERSRHLEQRLDLAREIHERVVQRLFGISLALSREEELDAETQQRCAVEVQRALGDLQAALRRPLGHSPRPTAVRFAEELERLSGLASELDIRLHEGSPDDVPLELEALAQSILVEAVRNARKHARATTVLVSLGIDGGAFVLDVRNDGAGTSKVGRGGVGLRLATLEAMQHDGVLEYGECEPGWWQVRLVVPQGQ